MVLLLAVANLTSTVTQDNDRGQDLVRAVATRLLNILNTKVSRKHFNPWNSGHESIDGQISRINLTVIPPDPSVQHMVSGSRRVTLDIRTAVWT